MVYTNAPIRSILKAAKIDGMVKGGGKHVHEPVCTLAQVHLALHCMHRAPCACTACAVHTSPPPPVRRPRSVLSFAAPPPCAHGATLYACRCAH